ncbi:hypothetical protein LY78DRAFT_44544 [Colletotrichum sublineola]|nr:hypothetical protein LY78DRAFT_44544 [Colletotrichum sublineola]
MSDGTYVLPRTPKVTWPRSLIFFTNPRVPRNVSSIPHICDENDGINVSSASLEAFGICLLFSLDFPSSCPQSPLSLRIWGQVSRCLCRHLKQSGSLVIFRIIHSVLNPSFLLCALQRHRDMDPCGLVDVCTSACRSKDEKMRLNDAVVTKGDARVNPGIGFQSRVANSRD